MPAPSSGPREGRRRRPRRRPVRARYAAAIGTVFANLRERKATILREEVAGAGAAAAADVRAARADVVATALRLESDGAIVIDLGAEEEQ